MTKKKQPDTIIDGPEGLLCVLCHFCGKAGDYSYESAHHDPNTFGLIDVWYLLAASDDDRRLALKIAETENTELLKSFIGFIKSKVELQKVKEEYERKVSGGKEK